MGVNLLWDATTALLAYTLGANTFHNVYWREREGGLLYPSPGLVNGAGAGKTGNVLITVGAAANATYAITLFMRKTTA